MTGNNNNNNNNIHNVQSIIAQTCNAEDQAGAEALVGSIYKIIPDPDYATAIPASATVTIEYDEGKPTYDFIIDNIRSSLISLRRLHDILNLSNVYAVDIKADVNNITNSRICISVFKQDVMDRTKKGVAVLREEERAHVARNIDGMTLDAVNLAAARTLMNQIVNMDRFMLEPSWTFNRTSSVSNSNSAYTLQAKPIEGFSVAFYDKLVRGPSKAIIRNITFGNATLVIYCSQINAQHPSSALLPVRRRAHHQQDADTEEEEDDEEEEREEDDDDDDNQMDHEDEEREHHRKVHSTRSNAGSPLGKADRHGARDSRLGVAKKAAAGKYNGSSSKKATKNVTKDNNGSSLLAWLWPF
jgi:hypothetical protein